MRWDHALRLSPFQLRGQMETTAATENTQIQKQHKSDMDLEDRGLDNMLRRSPRPVVDTKDQGIIDTVEKGQEGAIDHPVDHKQAGEGGAPRKPRRGGSQPGEVQPNRGSGDSGLPQSISRKNRVNGLLGQGKGRGIKESEEKTRHVNEA